MGLEAVCSLRVGRKRHAGKALLETNELIFRGETRLVIPFREIRSVKASARGLEVEHAGGKATFEIGAAAAERWAEKIRNPRSRIDKLGVKNGQVVSVLAIDDPDLEQELAAREASVSARVRKGSHWIFLGIRALRDLDRLASLRDSIDPAGAIWVVWPKGRREPNEDHVRAAAKRAGLVDVKVVAFSSTHSALKLVIPLAARPRSRDTRASI
jgi:hypothetical protein